MLYISDLEFGFKSNSITNMCTVFLRKLYHIKMGPQFLHFSSCYSKAFGRVQYCKIFRLVSQSRHPACTCIRILINLYTVNRVRVGSSKVKL